MTIGEARQGVADGVRLLGLKATIEIMEDFATELVDGFNDAGDKLARYRAASDHRNLVNLKDRLNN